MKSDVMMEFIDVLNKRHSIRAFKERPVEEDKLSKIMEAVNTAPSAGNLQAFEVYVVRDNKRKNDLSIAAIYQEFISEASVCLVFCANPARSAIKYGERGKTLYSLQDATIAATFAVLRAVDLGLGTAWVGAFDEQRVKQIIGAKEVRPVAIIPIGEPAESPRVSPRRKLKDLFHEI